MATAVISDYACGGAVPAYRAVLVERALRELHYRSEVTQVVLAGECSGLVWPDRAPLLPVFRASDFRSGASGVPDSVIASAPALCTPPFAYIIYEDGSPVRRCELRNPEIPHLTDFHIHTAFAYCSENMEPAATLELAGLMNLKHMAFSEHSAHLYFSRDFYGSPRRNEPLGGRPADCRMDDYLRLLSNFADGEFAIGSMELDVDRHGGIFACPEDVSRLDFCLGAVHELCDYSDPAAARRDFLLRVEGLGRSGVPVLAHPFRVFRWKKLPLDRDFYAGTIALLRRYGMTPELNFHGNAPDPEFFSMCIESGLRISLGSDSHNLCEIGAFLPHFGMLRELGVMNELDRVLLSFGCGKAGKIILNT